MATTLRAPGKALRPAPHISHLPARKKSTDPTVRTYRALTKLLVGDEDGAGTVHYRFYGDFIPEAEGWKNLATYLKQQQIEICYVNQSELDENLRLQTERFADEDAEKNAQADIDAEIALLQQRQAELLAKKRQQGNAVNPEMDNRFNGETPPKNLFESEQTQVEKIDFGSVKGGVLQKAPVPTRALPKPKRTVRTSRHPSSRESEDAVPQGYKKKG
jgi:hypothetical protein